MESEPKNKNDEVYRESSATSSEDGTGEQRRKNFNPDREHINARNRERRRLAQASKAEKAFLPVLAKKDPLQAIRIRLDKLVGPAMGYIEKIFNDPQALPRDKLAAAKYIIDTRLFINAIEMKVEQNSEDNNVQVKIVKALTDLSLNSAPSRMVEKYKDQVETEEIDGEIITEEDE